MATRPESTSWAVKYDYQSNQRLLCDMSQPAACTIDPGGAMYPRFECLKNAVTLPVFFNTELVLSPNTGVAFALNPKTLYRMVRGECTATTPRARQRPTLLVSARPRGRYNFTLLRRRDTFRLEFRGQF